MKSVIAIVALLGLNACSGGVCADLKQQYKETSVELATLLADPSGDDAVKRMEAATARLQQLGIEALKNECPINELTGQTG